MMIMTVRADFVWRAGSLILLLAMSAVTPTFGRAQTMSLLAPPKAAPVIVDTRKFSVVQNGLALGLPQRSGYVSVIDIEAVELLFILKVFDLPPETDGPAPSDRAEPVITSMTLDAAQAALLLGTDSGGSIGSIWPG